MDSRKRKFALPHEIIDLRDEADATSMSQSASTIQFHKHSVPEPSKGANRPDKPTSISTSNYISNGKGGKAMKTVNAMKKDNAGSSATKKPFCAPSEWPSFQLATYNVWFGDVHREERMTAIAENLLANRNSGSPLLFIGLQELTDDMSLLVAPFLDSTGYRVVCQPFQSYGTALAIHGDCTVVKSGFVPFGTTVMDRGILYAIARLPGSQKEILVITTHLESYLRPAWTGASQRQDQVKELKQFCEKHLNDRPTLQLAVVMGDLNWDDERPRSSSKGIDAPLMSLLDENWKDAWRETHPSNDSGYTYDSKLNPMLRGALRRRFDRCLVRPKSSGGVVVEEAIIFGQQVLPGLIWKKQYERPPGNVVVSDREVCASDHFGLAVKVRTEP